MRRAISFIDEPIDFPLAQGGPLYQLLLRAGLLSPPIGLAGRRIIVIVLVAWLPLLVLSALSGQFAGGTGVPFLHDVGAHVRLLVSIPLFLMAEVSVHRRIRPIARWFLDRGLVTPEDEPRFEGLIASAMRLRSSVLVEVALLAFALFGGYWLRERYLPMDVASWFAVPANGDTHPTVAGYWYLLVSMTIYRVLLLRWCFRMFIWYRFLWQVSRRIRLRLNALHPDRSGGLGFLSMSIFGFTPVLVAQTAALAGVLCGKIWHQGATLPQFKLEILTWIILLMLLVLTPLCFFLGQMLDAKVAGLKAYGLVASRYVAEFGRKWFEGHTAEGEALVGTADIQSLADLSNSFDVVREMRLAPFGKASVLQLALVLALPLSPLLLTMIPLEQLIDRMAGVFF